MAIELFKQVQSLRREGRTREALALLRDGLRRGRLDPEQVDRAGRMVRQAIEAGQVDIKPVRVRLIGQVTTSWVVNALTAVAWGRGACLAVDEGGYDTLLQDLSEPADGAARPDVIALIPWAARSLGGELSTEARVEDALAFWRQCWRLVSENHGAKLLQVGFDWSSPGPLGAHLSGAGGGPLVVTRALNAAVRAALPPGSYFLDLEHVSGALGRATFYDDRRYYWTKQPFSEAGGVALAEHLFAGVRALTTGPKKVLVLDLDNTLWGGVVGEVGPLGITLGDSPDGEAFRALQAHAKGLARRGVVLAVASKNNPADAREPFEANPDMVLKRDDFAAFEACWDPKALMIARIAETLNLGLDSFVFFDDHPAERELIRQALPDVEVVDVPEDPAGYVRALEAGLWFEAVALTDADRERAEQYAVEGRRRELQRAYYSMDDYLRSLEMVGDVRPIDEADLTRVVQLLAKTNQFNLTTRRHSREDVLALLDDPRSVGRTLRVRDRFGDYGLVAVVLAAPAGADAVRIDTLLMSCRVIGRTVEQFFVAATLDRFRELGYRRVLAEYIPTKKNALVSRLYDDLGFARLSAADGDGPVRYQFDLEATPNPTTFVRRCAGSEAPEAATAAS
ncbi:MAG TPA: HAD-IIIC family phosphatase [Isosphaeraceae bacterium]|jgi:FkbH-like protein|nr:HAD-IIIC family phosphatase [Isosphaeraceae bacterium]